MITDLWFPPKKGQFETQMTHWRYVAIATVAPGRQIGEKFFIAFLDELDNFEHFETYLIFRQFGDLATASCANLAIFDMEIANLAITIDYVRKWPNLGCK